MATQNQLIKIIDQINRQLNRPRSPYSKNTKGVLQAQPGCFCLGINTGYSLHEIINPQGGVHVHCFGRTKSELMSLLVAFLNGITIGQRETWRAALPEGILQEAALRRDAQGQKATDGAKSDIDSDSF